MSFRAATPANNAQGVEEANPLAELFAPGVVWGDPVLPIEDAPGESFTPAAPVGDNQTDWVTAPADKTPSPIASTRQTGAAEKWSLWTSLHQAVTIALPDGSDIRSLWVPVVPVQIFISLGNGQGSPLYTITTQGGEIVPIPRGCTLLTLSVSSQFTYKPDMWVYATSDVFPPMKVGGIPPAAPISGQTNANLVRQQTYGANHLWPLSDNGTSATDLIAGQTGQFRSLYFLGAQPPIAPDQTACAQSNAPWGSPQNPLMQTPIKDVNGGNSFSVELIFEVGPGSAGSQGTIVGNCDLNATDTGGFNLTYKNGSFGQTGLFFNILQGTASQFVGASYGAALSPGPHHFVLVFDTIGKVYALYLDGVTIAQITGNRTYYPATNFLAISSVAGGHGQSEGAGYYQSLVTYPAVLLASQVQALYHAAFGK
jgi:hypothetical protein